MLTIGANGRIKAQVFAKAVIILGEVTGNVTATEKVDIRDNGSVDGDIAAPRVAIAEGAHFRGSIDMQKGTAPKSDAKAASTPAAAASSERGQQLESGLRSRLDGRRHPRRCYPVRTGVTSSDPPSRTTTGAGGRVRSTRPPSTVS